MLAFHWESLVQERRSLFAVQTDDLSEEFGVFLHHDAITGTSMGKVDLDYFMRIEHLEKRAIQLIAEVISGSPAKAFLDRI